MVFTDPLLDTDIVVIDSPSPYRKEEAIEIQQSCRPGLRAELAWLPAHIAVNEVLLTPSSFPAMRWRSGLQSLLIHTGQGSLVTSRQGH